MRKILISFLMVLALVMPCFAADLQGMARDGRVTSDLPDGWQIEEKNKVKRITENTLYDHVFEAHNGRQYVSLFYVVDYDVTATGDGSIRYLEENLEDGVLKYDGYIVQEYYEVDNCSFTDLRNKLECKNGIVYGTETIKPEGYVSDIHAYSTLVGKGVYRVFVTGDLYNWGERPTKKQSSDMERILSSIEDSEYVKACKNELGDLEDYETVYEKMGPWGIITLILAGLGLLAKIVLFFIDSSDDEESEDEDEDEQEADQTEDENLKNLYKSGVILRKNIVK